MIIKKNKKVMSFNSMVCSCYGRTEKLSGLYYTKDSLSDKDRYELLEEKTNFRKRSIFKNFRLLGKDLEDV